MLLSMMQDVMPVTFVVFDYKDLYFKPQPNQNNTAIEQWFDEGVMVTTPVQPRLGLGPVMTIEQWTQRLQASSDKAKVSRDDLVLLHVLQMMPLRFDGWEHSLFVLHELTVSAWTLSHEQSLYRPGPYRYFAARRPEQRFYLVTSKWMSWSMIHNMRQDHRGLVFDTQCYERLLRNSDQLHRLMMEQVETGAAVTLGRTVAEISRNLDEMHRAKALLRRVLSLADVAYISISDFAPEDTLQGVSVLVTDSLDYVKAPPMPTPVGPDD